GAGLGLKTSRVTQTAEEERYSLAFLPMNLEWDTSNDLLDPSRGGRLGMEAIPFLDVSGEGLDFIKNRARYARYFQVSESPWVVLAGRATAGAISGAGRDEIPADERFYAGGGGSIRGYAYQSVGPYRDGNPVGGSSLLELSLELRTKVSDRLGMVAFLDGGGVFKELNPDPEEELLWGSGLGFRYFTPIGPLRFDVGVPLDRREGIDDAFQIYVTLGQAF
ncbi:MAG: BamA/TamA family outer membrane protein, partial [Deltaproteobacteria bacterium]|nr:BamA/TamA family outer membrane protein [Deltaproteobacteria bacterium]